MIDVDKFLAFIDDNEVIQLTRDLVAIPSITGQEGTGMLHVLERWFEDMAIPMRIYPTDDGRANFFADYGATGGPGRFLFNGHMDTKPVEGMTIDPFGGEIRDGRMYGRGACDMKSGLAAVMCAFKALVRGGFTPKGGITFYSDIEEECAGPSGMSAMIERGMLDGFEGIVSCEQTGVELQIGNRGCFGCTFEMKGRSAHSGLAHLGVNAIHNMALFILEYLKLPYLLVENPMFGKCTANFDKISGQLYLSAVPDRCMVELDSRIIPETPPELVRAQVEDLMDRLRREEGLDIGWQSPPDGATAAAFIPLDHPLVERARTAIRRALSTEPAISGCPGATIAGVMISRGTPAIILGPGNAAQAHTEDEWVEVAQIPKAARIYAVLMAGM